jgi:pimeloyl-ACP methyl ester carboxylesterase
VVLNDIGPELDPDGIRRIAGYAGSASSFANWDEAIVAYRERYVAAYPEWTPERWAEQAHHAMIERDGRIVFDYDPEVGRALAASGPPRDLWAMYGALGPLPVLILRGARSDLLNRRTAERMQQSLPNTTLVEVPGVGHAPTLDEDESVAAIESFLAAIVVHG